MRRTTTRPSSWSDGRMNNNNNNIKRKPTHKPPVWAHKIYTASEIWINPGMATTMEYITTFYEYPAISILESKQKLKSLQRHENRVDSLDIEHCFYVASAAPLCEDERQQIEWLIHPSYETSSRLKHASILRTQTDQGADVVVFEIGPRLNFCTPFSTNAVSIIRSSYPTTSVYRIERSKIYKIKYNSYTNDNSEITEQYTLSKLSLHLYDRMVETIYISPIESFRPKEDNTAKGKVEILPISDVDILGMGADALRSISVELGLFFDDWDVAFYVNLFKNIIKRNPTIVECFDLAQSNSEHSRHWFFKGELDIEGRGIVAKSLIDMVGSTQITSNQNNIIKFEDNSSAIIGFRDLHILQPHNSTEASLMEIKPSQTRHIIFTAETHNFPTGVAPFPGAATGTGGRIRDCQATGRGAHVIAGTAGYSFGNLFLEDYDLPWEDSNEIYPNNLATPARIAVEASNGASDYGNKFGEPIISGFARSFGMRLVGTKERWEYLKPIMFTGGIGSIDDRYIKKVKPEEGMKVAKLGGPVYRIGIGGGAASSANVTKSNDQTDQLNFNAVQRGDPEMEQKLNRLIRACIEYNGNGKEQGQDFNPILSIHDQGAGGNGNVLKEIVEPNGAIIDANKFTLGDPTINILELWAAEYQESDAILTSAKHEEMLNKISHREKVNVDIVGQVKDDGQIRVLNYAKDQQDKMFPIDLKLDYVVGSMPRKLFKLKDYDTRLDRGQLEIPPSTSDTVGPLMHSILERVLKLPSVASKRYLTTKVDRCVTGLIAGQQCLGPLHTPISDYALISLSHFNFQGAVTSIGEQPIKGLLSPQANATMSVAEALTNMMFCVITCLEDVKCSANWMWAAKLPGEGAKLVDACEAMCRLMSELGIAVDGGKDSLSMMATVNKGSSKLLRHSDRPKLSSESSKSVAGDELSHHEDEIVKSPGTLVISNYAPVPDIRCKVTPIMQCLPTSRLIWINFSCSLNDIYTPRLGGSALAQTFSQLGDVPPSLNSAQWLKSGFKLVQQLIKDGICTAGHDISDGGLIVCLIEMAIASHCGLKAEFRREGALKRLPKRLTCEDCIRYMFAEECGVIIEVDTSKISLDEVLTRFHQLQILAQEIGYGSYTDERVKITLSDQLLVDYSNNHQLRQQWEETSKRLDLLQANEHCVQEEYSLMSQRSIQPKWKLTFDSNAVRVWKIGHEHHYLAPKPQVAVIREEGINGDREMIASLCLAGFDVFDVTVTDLMSSRELSLMPFKGLVFPGGFSYADVFGSGRGWAATMRFNRRLRDELRQFRLRNNTFSLGVCNGCQLMSLLGFLEDPEEFLEEPTEGKHQEAFPTSSVKLTHNDSGRFECRFVNIRIEPKTNSIMLNGMQGSCFGVWVAHGEGKFEIGSKQNQQPEEEDHRIAIKYADDYGEPTQQYPLNPNGSKWATAGMCSRDGRHLAMMPHPERCTQMWQWPYIVPEWQDTIKISPWNKMFVNAFEYCCT